MELKYREILELRAKGVGEVVSNHEQADARDAGTVHGTWVIRTEVHAAVHASAHSLHESRREQHAARTRR